MFSPEGTPEYLTMDELYDLYVKFEEELLEHCVASAKLPWLQQHYCSSFQLRSFPAFCSWWAELSFTAQNYHRALWEGGDQSVA